MQEIGEEITSVNCNYYNSGLPAGLRRVLTPSSVGRTAM